tara:strand:- start:4350 stop:6881 length:2532 start_codon:yes stop_codon:yes gene_type:complete
MSATILGGDITVYFSTDNNQIRSEWTGAAAATRTMNEFYSGSMTLYALSAQMSERVNLTAQTPVDYTAVNGHYIDDTTIEHLTGGTVQSSGWGGAYGSTAVLVYRPYNSAGGAATDFAAADIGRTIVGTTSAYSGTILDFNTVVAGEFLVIRPDDPTVDFFDNETEAFTVTGGTGAALFNGTGTTGESKWSNPNSIAALSDNTLVYAYQSRSLTAAGAGADDKAKVIAAKGTDSWWGEGNIDVLIKVMENDVLFDQGFVSFYARQFSQLYAHSVLDLSAAARTPIALKTSDDINNNSGFRQLLTNAETGAGWTSADVGVRINEDVATPTWEAVLTAVSGTGPNYTMQFYPVADLTLPSASDQFEDLAATKDATMTAAASTGVNSEAAPDNTITITHAAIDRDINNGNGLQPYSIEIDAQATPQSVTGPPEEHPFYERLKFEARRGETGTGETDGIEGEQYIGNELHLSYSTPTGTFVEGEQLWMHDATNVLVATGILVADHTTDDELILRNIRTYTANPITQIGDNVAQASYTDLAVVDTVRAITPVEVSPFGTFAGGIFFGAPGVYVLDLFAGDEQAYRLTDDLGSAQTPPNTVSITVTNLLSGDSVAVFRRVSAGVGSDVDRAEYNPNASQGPATDLTAGLASMTVTGAISNEAPDAGKIQVVDVSNNNETFRLRYSSVARSAPGVFTFTPSTGAADAGGSSTLLVDAAADFVTDGVEVGDVARNITDGTAPALVTAVTDLNNLVTTALTGGVSNDWATGDSYEINVLPRPYVAGDDVWVPFILRESDATQEANSVIHTIDIPVRVVIRNAGVIQPEEFDNTITASGMSQAATRNADTIFV